jgi:hypothetical protein
MSTIEDNWADGGLDLPAVTGGVFGPRLMWTDEKRRREGDIR